MHEIYRNQELWKIPYSELLILAIAERVQRMAVCADIKPSTILNSLKVEVPKEKDSWDFFDYSHHHYFDFSHLKILTEREGIDLQINDILEFLEGADYYLQKISTPKLSNWPYLFCAQLQLICEKQSIAPSTVMCLFALIYSGKESLTWNSLGWKYLLRPEIIIVDLDNQINIYDNNINS